MEPKEHANLWRSELLDPVPVPGLANAATWQGTVLGTTRAPGKNHPLVGAWLVERYCPPAGICADPMFGPGGLWVRAPEKQLRAVYGCEIEEPLCQLARKNLECCQFRTTSVSCSDACHWEPPSLADLVLFSPPFLQNHSAGKTAHQQGIRERKSLHTMQEFGCHPGNLGRKSATEFWDAMTSVYTRVASYVRSSGHMVVVLRNRIRHGREMDEVGRHIHLMRDAGFVILGVHARDLQRPTGYQAWKFARDPNMAWIRYEWVVVAQVQSLRRLRGVSK
jgi:hypothetical protein